MKLIVSGLVLAVFVASLDQTILAGSLSSIASDLRDFSAASWLVSGYLIASIVSTPVCGRMSDLFGRRRLLLITGTIYICGSLFCALSSTMTVLIAMRVVQGVGAGGLRAVAMSAMSDLVSPRERGRCLFLDRLRRLIARWSDAWRLAIDDVGLAIRVLGLIVNRAYCMGSDLPTPSASRRLQYTCPDRLDRRYPHSRLYDPLGAVRERSA